MSLDAEKTFDSVRWSLLYKVLLQFGFDATKIETFAALYNKPTLRYKINGDLTKSGHSGKRNKTRPLFFTLFVEPLSQWQRTDKIGVTRPSGEQRMALFADDLLIILSQPLPTLQKLMKMLKEYSVLPGYKIYINKTQVLILDYE